MNRTALRLLGLFVCLLPFETVADERDLTNKVAIELNTVTEGDGTCTLTFLVTNRQTVDIDQLVYETVLFEADGRVAQLTLFDFGALPMGRPRVRQFAVPDLTCGNLGRVLFNGVQTCRAEGLAADACEGGLVPSSRVSVEVLG
ncbi:hypothetical protein [Litoreibacter roseus]|uniref:Tat pathway signal sequence domain protein n=1 Tax=Litoreibacter roseus TaxID=2601869 RepID=A0A6N6JHC6_9RHOB|nr:hypothetical protein [Litoreibacter roseus]GFE64688.1 hypothetical protein KIN_17620 [Litoreibacter roseus]